MKIAEAIIQFVADMTGMKADLAKGEATAKTSALRIGDSFKKALTFAFPAGIALGLGAIAKKSIDTADSLAKLSTRTGISVENLSKLQYAANLADVSIEEVGVATRMLAYKQKEAIRGNEKYTSAFDRLGISLDDLRSQDPLTLFKRMADGLQTVGNSGEKNALAFELLGGQGQGLLTLMKDISGEGWAKMSAEAERFGAVVSTDAAKAAEQFNDNITRLQTSFQGGANSMLNEFMPAIAALSDEMVNASAETVGWANPLKALGFIMKGLAAVAVALNRVIRSQFSSLTTLFKSGWEAIVAVSKGEFDKLPGITAKMDKAITAEVNDTLDDIEKAWDGIFNGAPKASAKVDEATAPIDGYGDAAKKAAEEAAKLSAEIYSQTLAAQLNAAKLREDAAAVDLLTEKILQFQLAQMRQAGATAPDLAAFEASQRELIAAEKVATAKKKLQEVNAKTLEQLREEIELRDASYAAQQSLASMELDLAQRKAAAMNDTAAMEAAGLARAEFEAQQRAQEISQLQISLDQKRALVLASEQLLMAEVAAIQLQYAAGWEGAIARSVDAYQKGMTSMEQATAQVASSTETLFTDVMFASIKGNIDELDDIFKSFIDSLIRQIVNMMAQKAVMQLMNMAGGSGGGQGGGFWGALFSYFGGGGSGAAAAGGAVWEGGFSPVKAFASGAVVADPTIGLVGEGNFDEAIIPMPNGAVPVQMFDGEKQAVESTHNFRIVIGTDVIQAGKTSEEEVLAIVNKSIARNGEIRRTIRSRG